jgi:hypothetical protein
MVAPLSDVNAACQQCHIADLDARAKVYADALGVEIGSGTVAPALGGDVAAVPVSVDSAPSVASNQDCNQVVADDPTAVDYVQNYDEIVLGKTPTNWGNMILMGMIGLMVVGGGGFVITREKLVSFSLSDMSKVEDEYPVDVVEMLPKIAGLNPKTRKSLTNFLDDPRKADKAIDLLEAVVRKYED